MIIDEKTGLYGNYGLWHVPFWQKPGFILATKIAMTIVLLAMIAFFVCYYVRYCRMRKLSLWDQALRDLNKIHYDHAGHLISDKEFYILLMAIVKCYLYGRFGYDVVGKTDIELIKILADHSAEEQLIKDITLLTHGSEIIKFANVQAAAYQITSDYQRVVEMIKRDIVVKR